MNKKNIVILTAVHPFKASGRTVIDLKEILKDNGHDVVIVTNAYLRDEIIDVISVKKLYKVILNKISSNFVSKKLINENSTDPRYYMYDQKSHKRKFNVNRILNKLPFKPEAFIYLFQQEFLNEEALYDLNKITGAPVYRYMADMAEMTGGCHYAWDCDGYMNNCGNCPGLNSDNPMDETYHNLKFKKKFIDSSEIYPIAASEWQMKQLIKSTLYKDIRKFKLLLPIDEKTFYSREKNESRLALGLPLDKKIIFFGAVNTVDKRKGAKELLSTLKLINECLPFEKGNEIHLAIGGRADDTFTDQVFSSTMLGFLDYNNLAKAYSAADVFVCPSIEDSGPSMINQSLMCGTPVVSFVMGVGLDLIKNYDTGYMAKLKDSNDLAKGIIYLLDLSDLDKEVVKNKCLLLARSSYSKGAFYFHLMNILNGN